MKRTFLRTAVPVTVLLSAVALMIGCNQPYEYRVVSTGENELTISDPEGTEQQTHEIAPDAKITLDGQDVDLQQLDAGDIVSVKTEQREGEEVVTAIKAKTKESVEAEAVESDSGAPLAPEGQPAPTPDDAAAPESEVTPQPEVAPPAAEPQIDPEEGAPPVSGESKEADEPDAESFEGKISSVSSVDNQFVITADNGVEHTFLVNDETKYTLDGEEVTFGDLAVDHKVTVMAEQEGEVFTAKSVVAMTE